MGNMSYCRFRNTLEDLLDCEEHLDEMLNHGGDEELTAAKRMIKVCNRIAAEFAEDYGD